MDKKQFDYIIYTDGAYSRQHDEGAFAYVMLDAMQEKVVKQGAWKIQRETNNRAELKAIIAAIYHLPQEAKSVKVVSDSQYALNTLSGRWGRNANKDLFDKFEEIIANHPIDIFYEWVKGHSGDIYNEICDQLCVNVLGYDPVDEYKKYIERK